jgi:hypothetical protein
MRVFLFSLLGSLGNDLRFLFAFSNFICFHLRLFVILFVIVNCDLELGIISALESVVGADFHEFFVNLDVRLGLSLVFIFSRKGFSLSLLLEVKQNHLDVLLGLRLTDELDGSLLVFPVSRFQVVIDSSSVAVFFLESLGDHTL